MKIYVDVVIFKNVLSLDRLYTYVADFETEVGDFILVDFNGDLLIALVLKKYSGELKSNIKDALKVVEELSPLNEAFINLGLWMKQFYVLTYGKAFGIICDFSKIYDLKYVTKDDGSKHPTYKAPQFEKELYFQSNMSIDEALAIIPTKAKNQISLLTDIYSKLDKVSVVSLTDIKESSSYQKRNFEIILSKGILAETMPKEESVNLKGIELNEAQSNVCIKISESDENKFLIRGVTGSGKTEIYFSLIQEAMNEGKSSLFLVPEIGLTPQMVERAKARFGENVSLIHSKLTSKERIRELEKIESGIPQVILGTRSAVFSKIKNLAYVIIDEEHDDSYKLDSHNKYDVREVARFIVENNYGSKLVLGSATPSIESYYKAKNEVYKLFLLEDRANEMPLPKVSIVDMREELRYGNTTIFSMDLMAGMKSVLNKNEQVLLFLNRRGYSPAISCRDCGHTIMCEACDIAMVYHKGQNMLKCHYCGKTKPFSKVCPNCGSKKIKQFGIGTEKLEESTEELFQDFKILRVDSDTTNKKQTYENNYNKIRDKDVDIVIGTQMITKGLDFPEITLVGVVAADMSLNIPEYDATEKTFQLLTQVAGRSGRSTKPGEVIIQTYNPDHYSITYAQNHDYEGFYETEIRLRKIFSYPPFKRLLTIVLLSANMEKVISTYKLLAEALQREIKVLNLNEDVVITSSESNPYLSKVNNRFQTKLMITSSVKNEKIIKNLIYEILIRNKNKMDLTGISVDLLLR